MTGPHYFRPGPLSADDAAALTRLSRALAGQTQLQARPPLSLVRQGFDGQPVLYLQPTTTPPVRTPLGMPCLVADAYGSVVGIAQRWAETDGTVTCEVGGLCACDSTDAVPPVPPPPPPPLNTIFVELLVAGAGTLVRGVTAGGYTTPTSTAGYAYFYVADGSYAVTLEDVFVGETVSWNLTGASSGTDSGSGAATDSFDVAGGDYVTVQFNITSPVGPPP